MVAVASEVGGDEEDRRRGGKERGAGVEGRGCRLRSSKEGDGDERKSRLIEAVVGGGEERSRGCRNLVEISSRSHWSGWLQIDSMWTKVDADDDGDDVRSKDRGAGRGWRDVGELVTIEVVAVEEEIEVVVVAWRGWIGRGRVTT